MADIKALIANTYGALADLLESAPESLWNGDSLCEGWPVRNVVAHMTMAVRLTPEQFGAEMDAARGDFTTLSNTVADRDAKLPHAELLAQLRSPELHAWLPPGGGEQGALNHVVIHSLDITVPHDEPSVAPQQALVAVLDNIVEQRGLFGVTLDGVRLEADDAEWSTGAAGDEATRAPLSQLVSLAAGRALPDGRALPRPSKESA